MIERAGKPMGVVIPASRYESIGGSLTGSGRETDEAPADLTAEELDLLVNSEIREVRREAARERMRAVVEKAWSTPFNLTEDEVHELVESAIQEVRSGRVGATSS